MRLISINHTTGLVLLCIIRTRTPVLHRTQTRISLAWSVLTVARSQLIKSFTTLPLAALRLNNARFLLRRPTRRSSRCRLDVAHVSGVTTKTKIFLLPLSYGPGGVRARAGRGNTQPRQVCGISSVGACCGQPVCRVARCFGAEIVGRAYGWQVDVLACVCLGSLE